MATTERKSSQEARALETEALQAVHCRVKQGRGSDLTTQSYDEISSRYEQYADVLDYTGPQILARTLEGLYPDDTQRGRVQILDVAAGTGLAGLAAYKSGFRHMDALDASQGMLHEAGKKNIYGKLYHQLITDNTLPIEQDSYDCIMIAGAMAENHIPCSAFREMIRLVKPGGYIVNVARVEHLENSSVYTERLEHMMTCLEREGRWTQVTRQTFDNYVPGKEGMVMVHQIL